MKLLKISRSQNQIKIEMLIESLKDLKELSTFLPKPSDTDISTLDQFLRKIKKKGIKDDIGNKFKFSGGEAKNKENELTVVKFKPYVPFHSTTHLNFARDIFPIDGFCYSESPNRTEGNRKSQKAKLDKKFTIPSPFPFKVCTNMEKLSYKELKNLIQEKKAVALPLSWPLYFYQHICEAENLENILKDCLNHFLREQIDPRLCYYVHRQHSWYRWVQGYLIELRSS